MKKARGWMRLWIVGAAGIVLAALIWGLAHKDVQNAQSSTDCIAFTVQKKTVKEDVGFTFEEATGANAAAPSATPSWNELRPAKRVQKDITTYSCSSYSQLLWSIIAALLAGLGLLIGGLAVRWVFAGFRNDNAQTH